MFVTTTQSFPDGAIGKKYVLARTSNGYELVPDGSKLPGIQVSAVNVPTVKPKVSSRLIELSSINKVCLVFIL